METRLPEGQVTGEAILKVFVLLLLIPVIGAVFAWARGRRVAAVGINGIAPLLVFGGSGVAMISNPPTNVTAGGVLMYAIPFADLVLCAVVLVVRKAPPLVFWWTWLVNLGTVGFLCYMAFFFRIF